MFEDSDPHFIQILQEAVEHRHQISGCQVITQNQSQLMNGERECPPDLPLTHINNTS